MGKALKILDALRFAYLGAWGVLFYLHATLNPSVPQVELLWYWGWLALCPLLLAQQAFQLKGEDSWQFKLPPVIVAALVVVFLVMFDLPWGFDTPLMTVPFGLSLVLIMGWYVIRDLDRGRQ